MRHLRRTRIPYTDPLRAGRHPFQVYLLVLATVSGVPYLFGYATAKAIEDQLPVWLALGWGLMLLTGSLLALVGSFWRGDYANGLTMERVGLSFTGTAAIIYGLCLMAVQDSIAPLAAVAAGVGAVIVLLYAKRGCPPWRMCLIVVIGGLLVAGGLLVLIETEARPFLVSHFIVIGFGVSCIRRSADIHQIFRRANADEPLPIEREGDGSDGR